MKTFSECFIMVVHEHMQTRICILFKKNGEQILIEIPGEISEATMPQPGKG